VRVTVVRRGGIAGVVRRGQLETSHLDNPDQAEELFRALPFGGDETPTAADRFHYEITVTDGTSTDGTSSRTARLGEGDLPRALRPVVDAALAAGTVD
jgi:hypothetical protein